ncbi:MAG: hypothetical protein AAB798_01360 [Patescibacteria group bacterium]
MNTVTAHASTKRSPALLIPQLDPQARVVAMRSIFGIWKKRMPDPIKEQKKIRKEWDRALPQR